MESKDCSIGMAFGVLLAWSVAAVVFAAEPGKPVEPPAQELYFVVDSLNPVLSEERYVRAFQTPRAAVEQFIISARDGDFERAALALNLNAVPEERRADRAPRLAEKFYYVLTQKLRINFNDIPDRPDGEIDPTAESTNPQAGKPRRSIKLGVIGSDFAEVEVRLERFKVPNASPIWLFSPRTVENIERLYKIHGPGPLMGYLPLTVKFGLMSNAPAWHWSAVVILGALALLCGWIIQKIIVGALRLTRFIRLAGLAESASGPVGLFSAAVVFHTVVFSWLSLSGPIVTTRPFVGALIAISVTWFGLRMIRAVSELASYAYLEKVALEGEWGARSRLTRLSVVRHVLTFIALALGLGITLQELNVFETLSLSLLASAGVVSVILGVASRDVLGNFMAGIQIALTQPACIGDSVCFEGHWGWIEQITYTYITIRTWDSRRVVVPLSYFISHPFENWSMKSAHTTMTIFLCVDYTTDVSLVRAKFQALIKDCKDWDGPAEAVLEVTGAKEDTMELRALCFAKDPPTAWKVHCEMREALIAFVRELEGGRFLPKRRLVINQDSIQQAGELKTPADTSESAEAPAGSGALPPHSKQA